ncbi:hypothetical protein [Brevibacillus sp. SAFN-007a]|uniref:hypothetical protein n=1 Tax=Brevibacillus sp. SAFN-007a TaxID=3436862 RepID=UPI003F7F1A32
MATVIQAHVRGPRGRIKRGQVIPWKKAKKKLLKKPHKWYGIDHGISLFGNPTKWNLRRARKTFSCQKAYKYCLHAGDKKKQRIPRALKRFTRDNRKQLEKMVKKIQAMPKGKLRKAIRSVPKGLLTWAEKTFIRKVLLCRRKHLKKAWKRVSKLFA